MATRKSVETVSVLQASAGKQRRVPLTVTGVTPALRNPLVPALQTRRGGAHARSKGGVRAMRKRELAERLWHESE